MKIDVLDHGFVALRNLSGPTRRPDGPYDADDTDPANSARMSFDSMDSGRTREADLKLCEYLMRNKHTTPIEMIECWIEMKMPIFVARQFVRHRTATINEMSGRYVTLPAEWYVPEHVGGKAKKAKQGQEDNLDPDLQRLFKSELHRECETSYDRYLFWIAQGLAPEHARMLLHPEPLYALAVETGFAQPDAFFILTGPQPRANRSERVRQSHRPVIANVFAKPDGFVR